MRRLPITRLANLTPLDQIGLPVWSAITPLARDLTTHLGKGVTHEAARVSALMEALERCAAEGSALVPERWSWRELVREGAATLHPRVFDLPPDTAFSEDARFDWVRAEDLVSGNDVLVPIDLAISPPRQGILRHVDTNGLASGNSVLEATVHALAEVIERDAISQDLFVSLHRDPQDGPEEGVTLRRRLDPRTWPPSSRRLAEAHLSRGLEVQADWIRTDIGVPTFRVLLTDPAFPCGGGCRERGFVGYGTAPDAELALQRAMTEAAQSRLAVIQGARDAFNRVPADPRDPGPREGATPRALHPFTAVGGFRSLSLEEDLLWLIQRLQQAGVRTILRMDLTRPDLGLPVVRLRVPGLACFAVNRRRIGWRCLRHLL
jgi:ribosomal protein S12 methylthiotransferase accessory factor